MKLKARISLYTNYWFRSDLSFNILAANDYCIDIIATFYNFRQVLESDWYDEPFSSKMKGKWNIRYDKKHVVKAPGNVTDTSNMKWVKVYYDRMTGMNVYGMNMELNWRGLFVRAEYNEYNTFWSYPVAQTLSKGKAHRRSERAWFINAEKSFGMWGVGAELFDYPLEYMQYWAPIDDNDDDDRYIGTRTDGSGRPEYPGLDADFDRYIDTTWDNQPYLDYFYDSIYIGDDFDHNGTVDEREDDRQIDLPYDTDSRGQHYFLKINPREASLLTFGHYDIKQEYMGGRNFTRYVKLEHHQRLKGIGEFLLYLKTERIKDDYRLDEGHHDLINNWTFTNYLSSRLEFIPNTNIINNIRYSTTYEVGDMRRPDGTEEEVRINFLQIYNGDTRIKRYGGYSLGLEHKVDYTLRISDASVIPEVNLRGYRLWKEKRIKEFKFMPMLKVVHSYGYYRQNNYQLFSYDRKPRILDVYPVIRFDYRIAPKTLLRLGIQGFSAFPQTHRSKSFKLGDYDRRNMLLAFENTSLYQGFNLVVLMGVRYTKTLYINDISRKDPGSTEYFITIQSEAIGGRTGFETG